LSTASWNAGIRNSTTFSDENVGIGTATPSFPLTISKDAPSSEIMFFIGNTKYSSTSSSGDSKIKFGWANHGAANITAYKASTNTTGFKLYTELGFNVSNLALTVDPSGSLTPTGNLIVGSGNGIDFSATSGTGTSELFDDYEEGTWTPTLTFGDASVGITYAVQGGTYTKVGNLVTGRFIIVLSNKGSSTGVATITGLPYTVNSADVGVASVEVASNFTTNVVQSGYTQNSTTTIVLNYFSSTGTALLDNTNFNNNTRLDMWFSYFV